MMKQLKLLITLCLLIAAVFGCELGDAAAEEAATIDYYKKEIEISRDIDPSDYTDVQPVEKRIYGETGELNAVFRFIYTDWAASGYYLNTRTNVYMIEDGTEVMHEYYMYEYESDDYTYLDDDGETVYVTDYLLNRGESYTPDEVLRLYYDVTYDDSYGTPADDYKVYTLIEDRRASDDVEIGRQESTYDFVGAYYEYKTEKFYSLDEDDNLALEREFACWYDAATFNYMYELYHTYYSNDSTEEVYYLTRYSRDDNGDIYEQADWVYDSTAAPVVPALGFLGSFTVPFPVPAVFYIDFANVGAKATVLKTAYDTQGNYIKDQRFFNGKLLEYTSYTYDRSSRMTDQSRYTQGGLLLHDRITTRYSEEVRDGVDYEIKVTTTFKYYDLSSDELQSRQLWDEARSVARSSGLIESSTINLNKREINNHYR